MSQLRDEAEALAQALEFGVCDVAEVVAWCDAQILREDLPFESLCEASLARECYPQDLAAILRRFPGTPVKSNVGRLLESLLDDRLTHDACRAEQVAEALFRMGLADELEDTCLSEIAWWVWDALDLAEAGYITESREQVVAQLAVALHQAAADAAVHWSFRFVARRADP